MTMRVPIVLLPLLLLLSCHTSPEMRRPVPPEGTLLFAFYNLEKAFDPAEDPALAGDDEFTPEGKMHWTEERLERKLANIARAIRSMDQERGPDLIGLCEVENRHVLERLVGEFLPVGEFDLVHADSPDERGIDIAILYRPAMMRLSGFRMHRIDLGEGERPTRDIMEATFIRDGRTFTVLVNHWPSRSGGETSSEPRRLAAARLAARIVDSLRALDAGADIVLMGDLNDEPSNASVRDMLDAWKYDPGGSSAHRLMNMAAPVAASDTIGSYFYRGDWETIDQIMLSSGALDSAGLSLYDMSERVFAPDFLRDAKAGDGMRPPYRTFKGTFYIGGTSDHFPVMLRVAWWR
jgi:predicted extracellular nuclease